MDKGLLCGPRILGLCLGLLCLSLAAAAAADDSAPASTAPAAANAASQPEPPQIYDLDTSLGFAVIKQLKLGSASMSAILDTGVNDITVPQPVFNQIEIQDQDKEDVLDFAGTSRPSDYGFAYLPAPGSGRRRSYELSVGDPADLGIADGIVPLDLFDSDLVLFAMSRSQLVLMNLDAGGASSQEVQAETGTARLKVLPYWRNPEGYFLGLSVGGQYYFALIDTGAQFSAFTDHFIAAHPDLFTATDKTAQTSGVHGGQYEQPLYELSGGVRLMGINPDADIPLQGVFAADPTLDFEGQPAADSALGGFSSAYAHDHGAAFPPVANIGMDILGRYFDFMFDTRQHYLILWPKEDTDKMFPLGEWDELGPERPYQFLQLLGQAGQ